MIAVGVDEVRVGAAENDRGLTHQLHKRGNGSGNRFSDDVGAVVAGNEHGAVEHINEGNLLIHVQPHGGRIRGNVHGCLGNGHFLVQVIHHHDPQQHCEDLGRRSGITARVRVLFKDDLSLAGCDQNGGEGVQLIRFQVFRMRFIIGRRFGRKGRLRNLLRRILRFRAGSGKADPERAHQNQQHGDDSSQAVSSSLKTVGSE